MKHVMILAWFTLVLASITGVSAAQNNGNCSIEDIEAWRNAAGFVWLEYGELIVEADSPQKLATLMELRRELESEPCPDPSVPLRDAIIAATDGVFSNLQLDPEAATYLERASDLYSEAGRILAAEIGAIDEGQTSTGEFAITSPADGGTVPVAIIVEGTFDPAQLDEDHHIWLFVEVPDGRMFPQAGNGCPGEDRIPLDLNRRRNTWQMHAQIGSDGDVGEEFGLVLGMANAEANAELNSRFDGWCNSNSFTGISQDDFFDVLGIEIVDDLLITRQ
jgi:hypothetical protein